jgi:type I restriction enzyme S subunit
LDENGVRFSGEWKTVRLKELLMEETSRNKDQSIQRVLSVTNHSGFVLPEDQFSKRVASVDVSNYKIVKAGQFAYNPSRINVGSFARLDKYDFGILSPMYVAFSLRENLLNSNFFLSWMSSNEANQRVVSNTQGSVRASVGFDALCSFPFKLPPMEEQEKIAAVLLSADQEIHVFKKQLDCIKQEKEALMQQLLTGKRRVKIDNKVVV